MVEMDNIDHVTVVQYSAWKCSIVVFMLMPLYTSGHDNSHPMTLVIQQNRTEDVR